MKQWATYTLIIHFLFVTSNFAQSEYLQHNVKSANNYSIVLFEQASKSPITQSDWRKIGLERTMTYLIPEFLVRLYDANFYSQNLLSSLKSLEASSPEIGFWEKAHLEIMIVKQLLLCLYSLEDEEVGEQAKSILDDIYLRYQNILDHYAVQKLPTYPALQDRASSEFRKDTMFWSGRVAGIADRCLIEVRQTMRGVHFNTKFQPASSHVKPLQGNAAKVFQQDIETDDDELWRKLRTEHSERIMNQRNRIY